MRLLRPRRFTIALLIGVLLGAGLVGLAVASDDPGSASFEVAAAWTGDQGVYTISGPDEEARDFSFELRGRSAMVDHTGTPRIVDEVAFIDPAREVRDFWGAPGRTAVILDAQDGHVVAFVDEWNHEDEEGSEEVGLARTMTFDRQHESQALPCGVHALLQGQRIVKGMKVPAAPCMGHWSESWYEVDAIGDGAARLTLWTEKGRVAELLYNSGIAYPVRVDTFRGADQVAHFELTAFDRGTKPLASPALPSPVHIEWAPRTPWMFDETGIEHPFPLSEAVTYAANDPSHGLGPWLATHPEAYIVDASYWDYERTSGDTIEWRATFRERDALHHLHIGKRQVASPGPIGDVLDALGQEAPSHYYYFQAATRNVEDYGTWWPAPTTLPTVASLWEFYEAWATREARPNLYEIWIDGDEDGPRVLVEAGRFRDYPEGRDDPNLTYSRDWAFVEVDATRDEHPFRFSDRGYDRPATHPGGASPMMGGVTPIRGAAFIPLDLGEAAGVGAAAFGAALVYYLWPVAKAGFVGLFSRVRHDRVLDNPTRRSIHDYILANPGCHYRGILGGLDISKGTLQHHLRKLEHTGLVTSARSGGYRCYFIRGEHSRHAMQSEGLLKSPVARGIVDACRLEPGITTGQLAGRLGVSAPTVSYHLRRLREAGLLGPRGRGHGAASAPPVT